MDSRFLGIVADDLTGAMDTAGSFAAKGLRTRVTLSLDCEWRDSRWKVLCYNTQTRNADPADTVKLVSAATRRMVHQGYSRLYKKIDSTLRGHIALETLAMLKESGKPYAFIVPAFPQQGRTQRDGVLYVNGTPLSTARNGSDPFYEFSSSSVVELLEGQLGPSVGLVDLSTVESSEAEIERRIRLLVGQGRALLAFDAIHNTHLTRIESVVSRCYPDGLLVGSAGLGRAMAINAVGSVHREGETTRLQVGPGPIVLVSGSINPATLAQLERLEEVQGISTIHMDVDAILGTRVQRQIEEARIHKEVGAAFERDKDVSLRWLGSRPTSPGSGVGGRLEARSICLNRFLQTSMSSLLHGLKYAGLVLVGGDTAHSVLTGLRAEGIDLEGEVMPGIPVGAISGGDADSRLVVAKAGGFGDQDALVEVIRYVRNLRESKST